MEFEILFSLVFVAFVSLLSLLTKSHMLKDLIMAQLRLDDQVCVSII